MENSDHMNRFDLWK